MITDAMADESLSEVDKVELSITGEAMKNSRSCTLQEHYDKIVNCSLLPVCKFRSRNFPAVFKNTCRRLYVGAGALFVHLNYHLFFRVKDQLMKSALVHYKHEGYGWKLRLTNFLPTVLCIFLWNVMYRDYVQYAFVSKIQWFPLDLPFNFYERRREKIDVVLNNIGKWSEKEFVSVVKKFWRNHSHKKALVNPNTFYDVEPLLQLLSCIDRKGLSNILRRLVINYNQNVKGFADVFVMNADKEVCIYIYLDFVCYLLKSFSTNLSTCYQKVKSARQSSCYG